MSDHEHSYWPNGQGGMECNCGMSLRGHVLAPTVDEANQIAGFGIDHPTMKTEAEVREMLAELRKALPSGTATVPLMIDCILWVLGEEPE